jgi:hypothetical protein
VYNHIGVITPLLPMPTSSSGDVIAVTSDLYLMVVAEVKAAASVGPAAEAQPFYNPVVYREIPDGTNAKCELFDSRLLIVGEALFQVF